MNRDLSRSTYNFIDTRPAIFIYIVIVLRLHS